MTRCCRCGCNKINFKAFRWTDGVLLWEKLLDRPVVGLSGDIYSLVTNKLSGPAYESQTNPAGAGTAATLKSYAEVIAAGSTIYEYRVLRTDELTGADTTTGAPFAYGSSFELQWPGPFGAAETEGFHSSFRPVDGNHDFVGVSRIHTVSPGVLFKQLADTATTGKITYYISAHTQSETIRLTTASGSFGSAVTVDFDTTDTPAAVETAVDTVLGARATVTASGAKAQLGTLILDIVWDDEDDHFDSGEVVAHADVWSQLALVSSVTGEITTMAPAVDTGFFPTANKIRFEIADQYTFSDNGELLCFGQHDTPAPFSSTVRRLYSMDVTSAWAKSWETERDQTGVTGERMYKIYARNGMVAATRGQPVPDVNVVSGRFTVSFLEEDGTNLEEIGVYTQGFPNLCILDDSTDAAVRTLYDFSETEEATFDVGDIYFGSGTPSSMKVIDTTSGDVDGHYELGELGGGYVAGQFTGSYGFQYGEILGKTLQACVDSTGAAFLQHRAFGAIENTYGAHSGDVVILSSRSDDVEGLQEEPTNRGWIYQIRTTFDQGGTLTRADLPNKSYRHEFTMVAPVGFNMGATQPRWRLRWVNNSGGATVDETDWLDFDADETDVNTELLSVWGSNSSGGPNCELSGASNYNDSGTGHDLVVPQLPFWCQYFIVYNYGPHADEGYTGRGGTNPTSQPEVFDNISTVRMQLILENPATFGAGNISVMDLDDGMARWSRHYSTPGKTPIDAYQIALNDGTLFARGPRMCAEPMPPLLSISIDASYSWVVGHVAQISITYTYNGDNTIYRVDGIATTTTPGTIQNLTDVDILLNAGSESLTGDYEITQADIDAGSVSFDIFGEGTEQTTGDTLTTPVFTLVLGP